MRGKVVSVLVFGLLLAAVSVTEAANRVDATRRARETMKMRRDRMEFFKRDGEGLSVKDLLQLAEGEEMAVTRKSKNVQGTNVERLEQSYHGIPVFDTVVTVRTDIYGELTGDATGVLITDIDQDVQDLNPKLTEDELLDTVLQAEGDKDDKDYQIGDVQFQPMIYTDTKDIAHLASRVSYLIDGVKRPKYIVDVNSGEVLRHWQDLDTFDCGERTYKAYGGNVKIGKIKYGDMPYCLNMTEVDGICYLENQYIRVVDMKFTMDEHVTETASFPCKDGYDDEVNDGYSPAIDAFFYGTVVGKMFEDWFDSTPLEDKPVLRVHYGSNYEDAFWNGVNCTFGDGQTTFYPMTSLDVVGHEIGHGVTEQGSGLIYSDESGGINEAFSDMLGEASEKFIEQNDMLVGYAVDKQGQGVREFQNPTSDGSSIDKVDQMETYADPHYSSGIYRRVFYVVVKQKDVPIREAVHVFLHANRMYWHPSSTFFDASCGTMKAAMDLGYSTTPYNRAFTDVGLEPCEVDNHIFSLTVNQTQPNVIVSSTIKPVFRFNVEEYSSNMWIEATSDSGSVNIILQRHSWEEDENGNPINVEDEGNLLLYVPNPSSDTFYIQFESADGTELNDVNIQATYV